MLNRYLILLTLITLSVKSNSNLNVDKIQEEIYRNFNVPSALYPKATKPIKRTDIKNSQTAMFSINQTSRYYLDNDIIVSPSNNSSTIITINASNTVIDLNGMVISQAHNNAATNLDAILVSNNCLSSWFGIPLFILMSIFGENEFLILL